MHFADDLVDTVSAAAEAAWESVASAVDRAWDGVCAAVEAAWDAVVMVVEAAWNAVTQALEAAWNVLVLAAELAISAALLVYETALRVLASVVEWLWELMQGIAELMKALGACAAGELVLQIAKSDNAIENAFKPLIGLSADIKRRLRAVFPDDNFDNVYCIEEARLSADHYKSGTDGMTFAAALTPMGPGYVLYLKPRFNFELPDFKRLLCHELIHVRQYRRLGGEMAFACAYGIGYADAGFDYEKNPLEDEAYEFVKQREERIAAL
jgi:hypothetical protein